MSAPGGSTYSIQFVIGELTGRESLLRGTISIPSKLELFDVLGGVDGRVAATSPMGFEPNPNAAPVTVAALKLNSGCWGGVTFLELSELVLAERSDIHILFESRSLSESSPLLVLFLRREDRSLNELERGLWWRFSRERWPSLGLRRLGRRRW